MEREVGGGIGMGNTCKPLAVSFQCMTKSTTNKKKKKRSPESFTLSPTLRITFVENFIFLLETICTLDDVTVKHKVSIQSNAICKEI